MALKLPSYCSPYLITVFCISHRALILATKGCHLIKLVKVNKQKYLV